MDRVFVRRWWEEEAGDEEDGEVMDVDMDEMDTTEAAAVGASDLALPRAPKWMANQKRARAGHEASAAGSEGFDDMDVSG